MLLDTFGRRHNNLRVSVTDRCNLRCTYCMPEDVRFMDRSELLTFEEITHFVRVASPLGIDKVRLTGGEPLMRRHLERLVAMLVAVPGIKDVGLTTNGLLLAEQARALRAPNLIVPAQAIDAQSLIAYADLVVSAGGTMNREAVALGTPVYTTFSGRMGGVARPKPPAPRSARTPTRAPSRAAICRLKRMPSS